MNAILNAITKLEQIKGAVVALPSKVTPHALDLKRAELRLGIGTDGLMPSYANEDYLFWKRGLGTYNAGGKYDLFVSGYLSKGLEATEDKGIIKVGNSPGSPDYADKFSEHTEGISDKGAEQTIERAGRMLISDIEQILR